MGPKKIQAGDTKKTDKKKVEKIIEDRTFGLKNKNKSHAVQKYIKGVEQVVKAKTGLAVDKSKEFLDKAEKKKAKEEEAFLNSLYKQVKAARQQELEEGQEAKNVLCQFFKAGNCEKGDECEFSHDLNIEFNQGAFDIYTDLRDAKKTMGVEFEVNKIAEEKEKKRSKLPQSYIVCKFFLDAVQRKVYGWKWECPNGEDCHYKHCLPRGYIVMTNKDKMQEEMTMEEYMDLEEQIDLERERIAKTGTPVNDKTFLEWKAKRDEFRSLGKEDEDKKKKLLTGIQLFKKQSELFEDDADAEDVKVEQEELIDINKQEGEPIEDDNVVKEEVKAKTEDEILNELENDLLGIKINAELFQGGENLDELDNIIEEEGAENKKEELQQEDNINANNKCNDNEQDIN